MRIGHALFPLLIFGMIASGGAITTDDVIDFSCTAPMVSWLNPACTPILADDVEGNSGEEVMDGVYKAALFVEDNKEQVLTEKKSRLNQTFGMAMSDAKLTAIEHLNDNKQVSTAKTAATNDIDNYYSLLQTSVISYRNRNILKMNESINKIEETSGVTCGDVFKAQQLDDSSNMNTEPQWIGVTCEELRFSETNKTLYNGTEITKLELDVNLTDFVDYGDSIEDHQNDFVNQDSYTIHVTDSDGGLSDTSNHEVPTTLKVSDSYGNLTRMYDGAAYFNTTDLLYNRKTQAYDNMLNLVDGIYNDYPAGSINVSDALGPLEELQTASTSYSDTGYYSYLATSFEQMGLAYNESYAFKLEWQNSDMSDSQTAVGQLFVPESSWNTTFETGETYNATDKTAWFVHATDFGKATSTELTGNFTILEMTDKETGEEINKTSVQITEFRTDGTADLQEQLEELKERQDELLTELNTGGVLNGVEGFFSDLAESLGIDPELVMAAAVIIGLVFFSVIIR